MYKHFAVLAVGTNMVRFYWDADVATNHCSLFSASSTSIFFRQASLQFDYLLLVCNGSREQPTFGDFS
ncbi:hypothetical protein F0562_034654 [Nyssa sinensis]|uniref:Uncharacterized protein n=1 Tax=Nyssa sinensis TaxID=561372 RepID=A0A5J5AAC6_9ASTE|nr:hypothetical protein F0562_034654 [Nyssa sinensis]